MDIGCRIIYILNQSLAVFSLLWWTYYILYILSKTTLDYGGGVSVGVLINPHRTLARHAKKSV